MFGPLTVSTWFPSWDPSHAYAETLLHTPEHHLKTLGLTYKMDVKCLQLSLLALVTLCFTFLFQKGEYNLHLCINRTLLSVQRSIYFFFSPAFLLSVCPKNATRALFDLCEGYFLWHGVLWRRIWRGQSMDERRANSIILKQKKLFPLYCMFRLLLYINKWTRYTIFQITETYKNRMFLKNPIIHYFNI